MSAHHVRLVVSDSCLRDLELRAVMTMDDPEGPCGGKAVLDAITRRERLSTKSNRIRCSEEVLDFIRQQAPDIARRWPAVFGPVQMPRSLTLSLIGQHAVGRWITGLEVDRDGIAKLILDGGDQIVLEPDGSIDYVCWCSPVVGACLADGADADPVPESR